MTPISGIDRGLAGNDSVRHPVQAGMKLPDGFMTLWRANKPPMQELTGEFPLRGNDFRNSCTLARDSGGRPETHLTGLSVHKVQGA